MIQYYQHIFCYLNWEVNDFLMLNSLLYLQLSADFFWSWIRIAVGAKHFYLRVAKYLFAFTVLVFWNVVFPVPNKGEAQGVVLWYLYGSPAWEANLQLQLIQKVAEKISSCLGIVCYDESAREIHILYEIFPFM
jgi:hypothetical protein